MKLEEIRKLCIETKSKVINSSSDDSWYWCDAMIDLTAACQKLADIVEAAVTLRNASRECLGQEDEYFEAEAAFDTAVTALDEDA